MFDFLKQKITGFIESITKKEEKKPGEGGAAPAAKEQEKPAEARAGTAGRKPEPEKKTTPEPEEEKQPAAAEKKPGQAARMEERGKGEVKLGLAKHIGALVTGQVEISRNDVVDLLDRLELELLESDVAIGVAEEIRKELESRMTGKKVKRGEVGSFVRSAVREALTGIAGTGKALDLVSAVEAYEKPVRIMFLGVNGSGKSTTIAKVAAMLLKERYKVVLAASDTFRAAAIEQLSHHAERLGVKVIKREYGSDPTAVAYDAVNYARAHGIDAVLVDTAGRQDTNVSLLNELKKMNRVIAPQLRIYVGESIAGNAIVEQIQAFSREIGVDGTILTKLDCDPKGGSVLSIAKVTGIPVMYLGTGQGYEDIEKFDARKVVERILG